MAKGNLMNEKMRTQNRDGIELNNWCVVVV